MLRDNNFNTSYSIESSAGSKGFSPSDYIASLALLASILSILITYRLVFLARKLEISFRVFELTGLDNIERLLKPIDTIFELNGADLLNVHINEITDHLSDLELFAFKFCKLYKTFDPDKLIQIKDAFSDMLYLDLTSEVRYYKAEFLAFKISFIHHLYKYAAENKLVTK